MYPLLAETIIYPLSDLVLGTSVMKYYRELRETQWWPRARLEELQNRKLRTLIEHAYNKVPYYRRMFDELGIKSSDIQTVEDLRKLPVLTKKKIRQNSKDMVADDFKKKKPIKSSTGGSTGEPLKFYITLDVASINWAGIFRGFSWGGYRIGDKRIKFGGSSIIPDKSPTFFERARNTLERNFPISAIKLNEQKFNDFKQEMINVRCKYIYGYPSSLYLFAKYCNDHEVNDIEFNAMFSTSEMLLPKYRETIEEQFKCKVFDIYGSYDGGVQAMECEVHKGFHISIEKTVVEIVDDHGKNLPSGESGRIIVTDLHNYAMPFIRYEVGDIGALSDEYCSCGRGLPLLKNITGRIPDIIKFSNGNSLTGAAVPCMLRECHIRQFQLIQDSENELSVNIVKDNSYSENDSKYIKNTLEYHSGEGVQVKINFCDEIPLEENGKYRFIISKFHEQLENDTRNLVANNH